jgi:two-component system, OmpR family, sensor kinase
MIRPILNWWLKLRLVAKLTLIFLAVTLTVIPATLTLISLTSQSVFRDIENKDVTAQNARALNAMRRFEEGLGNNLGDYADWDDSYAYLDKPNTAFEESTLNPLTFANMGVDVVGYVRFDGTVVFAKAVDRNSKTVLVNESAIFSDHVSAGAFFKAAKAKSTHMAYTRTKRGIYMLNSRWLRKSDGTGDTRGFIVMANLLEPQMLSDALQSDAKINMAPSGIAAQRLKAKTNAVVSVKEDTQIATSMGLFGQNEQLLATVEFQTPRTLIIAGRESMALLVFGLLAGLTLMIGSLVWAIREISVRRLQKLEKFVGDYRNDATLDPTITKGQDEIASLGRAFEQLSRELNEAEHELRQSSYLQGKADSAAGMLHNVRNALAPIRVIQEKWLREESLPFRQNMVRAANELSQDGIDPERKAALEAFLISAARQIAMATPGRLTEMEESKESVDQISAILSGYNFNTSGATGGDALDFMKLLRHEIKTLDGREGANVVFDLPDDMPMVVGNPLHLSQVVGNILVNADEAMIAVGVSEKRLAVRFTETRDGQIEIRLTDNGDGIAAENIPATFKREYSTRSHKAGGIGLHWSANAMRAMGGSIALESDGPGLGATAVLVLRRAAVDLQQIEDRAAA